MPTITTDNIFAQLAAGKEPPQSVRVPVPGRTKSGVIVDADRMMRISACWACLRYLSQTTGRLPWNLKGFDGVSTEIQTSHPVQYLLESRPSIEYSSLQFRETLLHWALRWGNGYAEIERSINGRPLALWPLHPSRVIVNRDLDTGDLFYRAYRQI